MLIWFYPTKNPLRSPKSRFASTESPLFFKKVGAVHLARLLLLPESNPAFFIVVRTHFQNNFISDQNPDMIDPHPAG